MQRPLSSQVHWLRELSAGKAQSLRQNTCNSPAVSSKAPERVGASGRQCGKYTPAANSSGPFVDLGTRRFATSTPSCQP
jgi:hypothetical protein